MFENLQERLEKSFKIIKGQGKISEINVAETLKDVRKSLVEADVAYKVAKQFTDSVKKKAMGRDVIKSLNPKEMMLGIIKQEFVELMGTEKVTLNLKSNPSIILMSGLQGSGKTTFSAKLALKLKSKGRHPLLVACDVYRPAAIDQLKVLGEKIEVPVYSEVGNKNPVEIARHAIDTAKNGHNDVIIVDTAGRLAIDKEMMDEIANIKSAINPNETLFVVDAMTGQDAVNTAKEFNNRIDFDGVIMTKLDGDTRGGAALSIRAVVDKPIKFIGSGEKLEDIDEFNPEGMASRIMGQGDLWTLAGRAKDAIDEEEARKIHEKIRRNKFDFNDFLDQIQKIKKMGNIKDLASMIPGVGKAIRDIDIDNDAFKGIEAMIYSMTPYERENPDKIDISRRRRIAKGSGTTLEEVARLIKQFQESRKIMKGFSSKKNMMSMMNNMKKMKQNQGLRR